MGIYYQILQIITDFSFGSEAVLTASQTFATEQMALWLTLGCVLAPFVLIFWALKKVMF